MISLRVDLLDDYFSTSLLHFFTFVSFMSHGYLPFHLYKLVIVLIHFDQLQIELLLSILNLSE